MSCRPSKNGMGLILAVVGILVLPFLAQAPAAEFPAASGMWRVHVKTVVLDSRNKQPVVVLEDKIQGRMIPIWIGMAEARAIMMQLRGVTPKRPMTHDLLRNIIGGLKAKVVRVVITELKGGMFYAHIEMKSPDRSFFIDSRPSDAIALALRVKAPIFAKAQVLRDGELRRFGSSLTHRKRMGVVLQSLTPSLSRYFGGGDAAGLLVSQVFAGKPAERSGLRRGDVIIQVGGRKVSTVESFEREFLNRGREMNISVRRGPRGENIRLRIELAGVESAGAGQ